MSGFAWDWRVPRKAVPAIAMCGICAWVLVGCQILHRSRWKRVAVENAGSPRADTVDLDAHTLVKNGATRTVWIRIRGRAGQSLHRYALNCADRSYAITMSQFNSSALDSVYAEYRKQVPVPPSAPVLPESIQEAVLDSACR